MKRKVFSLSVLVLSVVFGMLLFPSAGFAQVGISLFPIKFRVTINPGDTYSDTVTVMNPNSFPIGVQPEIENIGGGDEGAITLIAGDAPYGLMSWIQMTKDPFTLAPNERRQVPFSIVIPKDGEPGGHYGAILFRAIQPTNGTSTQSGVGVSGRVGSVILVEVPGATQKTGELYNFTGPSYMSHGPVTFTFHVKDTGNTHFDPTGAVTVSGWFMADAVLPFESRVVFPGYSRTFTATWPSRYAFGPLTAKVEVQMPDGGTQVATLSFFAFPWQEGLIVVVGLSALWFVARFFKRKFKIVKVS